jgi:hypothetical protein
MTMSFTLLWQPVLSLTLALFLALPSNRLNRHLQVLLLLALTGFTLIQINGITIAIYIRSIVDDLAITTLLALLLATLIRLKLVPTPSKLHQTELLWCFALLSLILYPSALGSTYFDTYRLGYSPRLLLIGIAVLCLWLLWRNNITATLLLGAATLAFSFNLKESNNYWDYLLDPALSIYCLVVLTRRFIPGRYQPA